MTIAKITSKNQLTLPKSVTQAVSATDYFDVEVRAGQIILTPVRIQRGDSVRAKLAELNLRERDVADAISWVRDSQTVPVVAAERAPPYDRGAAQGLPASGARKKATRKTVSRA